MLEPFRVVAGLAVTAVLGFWREPRRYARMAAWLSGFLAAIAAWAAFVVIGLPPIFGFA